MTERPRRPTSNQNRGPPIATDWKTPYEAALREQDPAKLPEACELARSAIVERELELSPISTPEAPEREELEEALRQIFIHEQKTGRPG